MELLIAVAVLAIPGIATRFALQYSCGGIIQLCMRRTAGASAVLVGLFNLLLGIGFTGLAVYLWWMALTVAAALPVWAIIASNALIALTAVELNMAVTTHRP